MVQQRAETRRSRRVAILSLAAEPAANGPGGIGVPDANSAINALGWWYQSSQPLCPSQVKFTTS